MLICAFNNVWRFQFHELEAIGVVVKIPFEEVAELIYPGLHVLDGLQIVWWQ